MEHLSSTHQSPLLHDVRVLIVDDDTDSSTLFVFTLEDSGAKTKVATTASDALELVQQFKPNVLLSDISLPDADGYTLIRWVRDLPADRGGKTPAIAVTGFALSEVCDRALAEGFQQCLLKPVDLDELIASVANLAKSEQAIER